MVFNWFRRQFKGSEKSPEESKVKQPEVSETEETQTTSPESESQGSADGESEAAADDLNWAKAAYEHIQQAKTDSSALATSSEPSKTAEQMETSAVATELEAPREIDNESKKPKSFLERAKSERLGRLEELKERAIVEAESEPEPEPVLSEQTPDDSAVEIAFDEGFVWSAEVLKAQGRRPDRVSVEEITWLKRLRQGLGKTRRGLINQLKAIVGQGPLNQDAVTEIEALLLSADVGVQVCDRIIDRLQAKLREETLPPEAAIAYMKQVLRDILDNPGGKGYDKNFAPEKDTLNIWLVTGVNGVGKTTTIGKIAHLAQTSDYRCLIGAADTFRAAAVEQIKVWGTRSGTEVIANQGQNTDPAAVVFDAIAAAQARNTELLLIDTAGRLQNKQNLMEELRKIRRIIDKKAPDARVESLLVLDATLGQNGLRQAEIFREVASLSGVVLTKLDGTAKGGVALAVAEQLGLPIRFIGAGEGIEDLRPFSSYEFVEALIGG
ncbi:MAG: signal recognition particle-docking protein FtsY [Hormoscilla sp. GUM202]|nr:signal recognition particle-docking protein FtsY [Hormoscilla sp. GUM202]